MGEQPEFTAPAGRPQRPAIGSLARISILLYAVIVMAIGWAYGLWQVQEDRALALEVGQQQLATLSKSLGLQIEAMVGDGLGAAIAGASLLQPGMGADEARHTVARMLTGGDYVRALFVLRQSELIIANAPGERFSPESAWQSELSQSAPRTWIGRILRDEATGALLLPIARRIPGAGGDDVWAGTLIRISDLDTVYSELLLSSLSVSLVTLDGWLVVQIPTAQGTTPHFDLRQTEVYRQFMQRPAQSITLMDGAHPVTGVPRQFAIFRIDGLPMVATAGRSVVDTLADWRRRTSTSLLVMAAATLAVLGLAFALQRVLNRRWSALQKSEERYELAAAGTNDGLFEWEADTGKVFLTPRARELLQLPDDGTDADFDTLQGILHPDDKPAFVTAFRRHHDEGVRLDLEARVRIDGSWRWFRIRGQAVWNERHEPLRLAGAFGDIHETVQAQQAIAAARRAEIDAKQSLARELLLAQEHERKRLAGELHDGVGQNLSLLRNRVILLRRAGLPAEAQPHAQSLLDLATESINDLRDVAQNLRPMHLEELGVTSALRALVEKVSQSSDLQVHARIEDVDDVIRGSDATHVYRIAQEAINNVLRHADGRQLWVDVIRDITTVEICVRDDGRGMPATASVGRRGLGLLSIGERCAILGAELMLAPNGATGTLLRVRITLPASAESHRLPALGGLHG